MFSYRTKQTRQRAKIIYISTVPFSVSSGPIRSVRRRQCSLIWIRSMDCIYLDSAPVKFVGLRVIESNPTQHKLLEEVSNLEARQRELKEENARLRALLAETPHQRIQYKILEKVSTIPSLLYEI
jgi:hypothetical protein